MNKKIHVVFISARVKTITTRCRGRPPRHSHPACTTHASCNFPEKLEIIYWPEADNKGDGTWRSRRGVRSSRERGVGGQRAAPWLGGGGVFWDQPARADEATERRWRPPARRPRAPFVRSDTEWEGGGPRSRSQARRATPRRTRPAPRPRLLPRSAMRVPPWRV